MQKMNDKAKPLPKPPKPAPAGPDTWRFSDWAAL